MDNLPGYYAVLTADVRYDDTLEPNAKLLYAEITALCNRTGVCFATNGYFANLYKVTIRSIIRWKKSLEEGGYIFIDEKWNVILAEQNCHGGVTKLSLLYI